MAEVLSQEVVVYQEHIVDFYGDQIISIQDENNDVWSPVKGLCGAIGIKGVQDQINKIKNDGAFRFKASLVTALDGKNYSTFCIHADDIPMWLATIGTGRVDESVKSKLILYKRECANVLRDYWTKGAAVNPRLGNLDVDQIKNIVNEALQVALDEYRQARTPEEIAQLIFERDVVILAETANRVESPFRDSIYRRIEVLMDSRFGKLEPAEEAELVKGLTPLTESLFRKLYLGQGWCRDKLALYFPKELSSKTQFDQLLKMWDIPAPKRQSRTSIAFARRLLRENHVNKKTINQLITEFNRSRESILRAISDQWNSLNKSFKKYCTAGIIPKGRAYSDYIDRSPLWVAKREAFKETFDNTCFYCGYQSPTGIAVHHLNYIRSGQELPTDLEIVCNTCHQKRHKEKYNV